MFGNQCVPNDDQHCGSHDITCDAFEECQEGHCVYIAACANGIVDEDEDCDFGNPEIAEKTPMYGIYGLLDGIPLCNPITCKRAPYCGDGIIQPEYEQCDGTFGCTSTCTIKVD